MPRGFPTHPVERGGKGKRDEIEQENKEKERKERKGKKSGRKERKGGKRGREEREKDEYKLSPKKKGG